MIYVMLPTYNEKENIAKLIEVILALNIPKLHIVVLDDNSPDQTWKIVQDLAKKHRNVHLLLRKKNRGRGHAGRDGFLYCLEHGAERIIEMDADFSHDPRYIPRLLKAAESADLAVGSRNVCGGKDIERGIGRHLLTELARAYIFFVLGITIKDPTSGYRCFTRAGLQAIDPYSLKAPDPFIITEVLYRAHRRRIKIKEVPILFHQRIAGTSKLDGKILLSNLWRILKLRFS
ncbi:MAG: polyprenol monophosphomannose synthase [Nanoarchaeota archaeon]